MKTQKTKQITIVVLIAMLTISFGFKKTKSPIKLPKLIKKQFAFVPQGKVFNGKDTVSVDAFYMSKYEVTNIAYKEFLAFLKREGKTKEFNIAQIDSNKWKTPLAYNEPLIQYYHTHQAYYNYPVVNISFEGAKMYCEWLTKILNDKNPKFAYKILVRLPNRNEWLSAANGNNICQKYAWGGSYLRNSRGLVLCNLRIIGEENLSWDKTKNKLKINDNFDDVNGKLNDGADITALVNSYFPNIFGIYNLNGNVAELVTEKVACGGSWQSLGYEVRNQSTVKYEQPACTIGFRPILVLEKK